MYRFILTTLLTSSFLVSSIQHSYGETEKDSVEIKEVKRYIRPCIYFNHYRTPERRNATFKQYRFVQNNLGFYLPLYTKTWYNKDSISISTIHLLGVAEASRYKPTIDFLNESYVIGRMNASIRLFYSDGNKSILFASVSPFVSEEFRRFGKSPTRFSLAVIYNRTVSRKFAYRLGVARTYTFGRALPIPIIGFRIGQLDKVHFNFQLPRNISLEIPVGKSVTWSIFARAMGGIYNIETTDTLVAPIGTKAILTRYELLNGMQVNFRTSDHFSFYISGGFVRNRILNYRFEDDQAALGYGFDRNDIPSSIFVNFGLSIRLGKAKRINNNTLLYDVMDMNTLRGNLYNNAGPMDSEIPANPKKYEIDSVKKLNYKDVEDLILDEY